MLPIADRSRRNYPGTILVLNQLKLLFRHDRAFPSLGHLSGGSASPPQLHPFPDELGQLLLLLLLPLWLLLLLLLLWLLLSLWLPLL
jgi:hypothetical protein